MIASAATWTVGLWRLAAGRIRADWRFLVGVWLLLACATSLLASGIVYGDAVAVGSLRAAIRGAPPAEQGVTIESILPPAQVGAADGAVRSALASMLGTTGGSIGLELRSGSLARIGQAATGTSQPLTVLESADDVADHAQLTGGRWPVAGQQPNEAVVSDGAATAMGLRIGETVGLADASTPGADPTKAIATVTIVGTYRPDPGDAAWAGDELDLQGAGPINGTLYQGPLVVDPVDLKALGLARLDARWRAVPDLDRLTADGIEPLQTGIDALPAVVRATFPPGGSASVSLQLGARLDALAQSLQVARAAVLLLTLQFAVVAAYAVLLVSGMLADRRRPEIGLLRSRGASTAHVAALAFGEAFLLAVPAVAVAPFVAAGLVRVLGRIGPLAATGVVADATPSPTALLVIVVTGLLAALVLALPALASGAEVAGIRGVLGRPLATTLAQRLGIDVALVAVAAVAIWQLRAYGQPLTHDVHGVLGLDPLLAAAPAFGLVAGGVVATRLVPRLGEVGERIFNRARGLLSPLAARQVARRPLRYTRAALLLILASALGTFGAVYATTWSGSHADQAADQVGGDLRVEPGPVTVVPDWSVGAAYRAIPGVIAALPVARSSLSVGTVVRDGVLVGVDAATAPGIMAMPPGGGAAGVPAGLAALASARPTVLTVTLPAGTAAIRVHLDAALTEQPFDIPGLGSFTVPSDYRGISLTAVVEDADGVIDRFGLPASAALALFEGRGQVVEIALDRPTDPSLRPTEPRGLLGLELALTNPFGNFANPIEGSVTITAIEAGSGGAAGWTPLPTDVTNGWSWQEADDAGALASLSTGATGRLSTEGRFASLGDVALRWVPEPPTDTRIPAIAGSQLLAATGSQVGDDVTASATGEAVTLAVVGQTAEFPTLMPDTPFAVVDGPTLALLSYLAGGSAGQPTEWWLTTEPGASPSVAEALAGPSLGSRAVTDRATILASLESDPVGLGTLGALLLGSLAATAFAVVGFLVGASVSARERIGEFALLRALGLSNGQLRRWLAAESAFLLVLGVLAGTGIGLLLAWLIVPSTLLGASGEPVVPTPSLVVPWSLIGLVYGGALALLVATIALVGRPLPGRTVATVLRAAEE